MIALFVMKLAAGITLMWWLMPRREVTDGFFRIQMRVVLALAVLAALLLARAGTWDGPEDEVLAFTRMWQQRLQIGVAIIAYFGSVFWALGRRSSGNLCIYLMAMAAVTSVFLHSWYTPTPCRAVQIISDVASSAVCGSVLTGMLLGHWYLTTPTMSTRPLKWFNGMIVFAALLRLGASGVMVFNEGIMMPGTTHWIWLAVRWIGTIVVPLVVAVLVWRIMKYRNTQSATGVLFAGLILVLMGEMSGALLERDLTIPY